MCSMERAACVLVDVEPPWAGPIRCVLTIFLWQRAFPAPPSPPSSCLLLAVVRRLLRPSPRGTRSRSPEATMPPRKTSSFTGRSRLGRWTKPATWSSRGRPPPRLVRTRGGYRNSCRFLHAPVTFESLAVDFFDWLSPLKLDVCWDTPSSILATLTSPSESHLTVLWRAAVHQIVPIQPFPSPIATKNNSCNRLHRKALPSWCVPLSPPNKYRHQNNSNPLRLRAAFSAGCTPLPANQNMCLARPRRSHRGRRAPKFTLASGTTRSSGGKCWPWAGGWRRTRECRAPSSKTSWCGSWAWIRY